MSILLFSRHKLANFRHSSFLSISTLYTPLIARLAKRRSIINQTLNAIHEFPMNLLGSEWETTHFVREALAQNLVCDTCREPYGDLTFCAVSWQSYWAHHASGALVKESIDESRYRAWGDWAMVVWDTLKKRLGDAF